MRSPISRRHFLKAAATLAAFPTIIPASALGLEGRPAPSNRFTTAVIGLGDRGGQHLDVLLDMPVTQMLAVCDPYRSKGEKFKKYAEDRYARTQPGGSLGGCKAYQDFREIVARPDIDTIFITAPENWHAAISIAAMRAGKDVYCEKALSLTVAEGRAMCSAVRRTARILQAGTQQRSDRNFRLACELARNGYLGNVHTVEVSVPGGRTLPLGTPSAPPPDLDYDLWLGPAPWTPYNDVKCTYNWYFMSDYCIGWIGSWGVHHVDIALWGAPALHRGRMEFSGTATFPTVGLADTSLSWDVQCTPASGPKLRFADQTIMPHGVRFIGDQGRVEVWRGGIKAEPDSLLTTNFSPGDERLPVSGHHLVNFFDSVKSRQDPIAPVETCHAATTLTTVADIATRLQRKLTWDWETESFVNDDAANRLLSRSLRGPWQV
jgi:hypothetical protein